MDEKLWILISWLHQKPADLDLHCFRKRVWNLENMRTVCCYMLNDGFLEDNGMAESDIIYTPTWSYGLQFPIGLENGYVLQHTSQSGAVPLNRTSL